MGGGFEERVHGWRAAQERESLYPVRFTWEEGERPGYAGVDFRRCVRIRSFALMRLTLGSVGMFAHVPAFLLVLLGGGPGIPGVLFAFRLRVPQEWA